MRKFFQATALFGILISGCSDGENMSPPELDLETVPVVEMEVSEPIAPPAVNPNTPSSNAKVQVTLSCRQGTLPKRSVRIMPLNARFMRLGLEPKFEIYGLEEDNPTAIFGNFGSDGLASFNLPAGVDKVEIRALPLVMDGDTVLVGSHNVSNDKDQTVWVERGKTVVKNFIMEQAFCDEHRDIREIGVTATTAATNFFVAIEGLGDNYDAEDGIRVLGLMGGAAHKRFYTRSRTHGDLARGKYGAKFTENRRVMRVRNIQTVRRVKRICGDSKFNMDMTIRSDMELGIKTFDGSGPTGIVQCKKAYVTHMPVSYVEDLDDDDFYRRELEANQLRLIPENNSARDMTEFRSTCAPEAAIMDAPYNWEIDCFEADQTTSKIFEYVPGDPIGRVHGYTVRFDLGGPELVEGQVNPGVEF